MIGPTRMVRPTRAKIHDVDQIAHALRDLKWTSPVSTHA